MFKIFFSFFVLVLALTAGSSLAFAQKETATGVEVERDVSLLRSDLRAEKKKIIAANLPLTEAEAEKFWPVYDKYIADITVVYDEFYGTVRDFAAIQKTATEEQSSELLKKWAQLMVEVHQTRQKYVPIVEKVIPARKAAIFFQIDRRLYSLIELQSIAEMPLLHSQ